MEPTDRQPNEPCGLSFEQLSGLADEDLMVHLKAGHNDALAVLFDRYHRLILSVAFKILRDATEAEDVMQSIFLEIYRVAGQFDAQRGSTKVWLLQYAYHRSMNRREYLKLRNYYDRGQVEGRESHSAERPAEGARPGLLAFPEVCCLVREGMESLDDSQRSALQMAYFEDMPLSDIAKKTGETLANVRHHYYRGLSRLRSLFQNPHGSGDSPSIRKSKKGNYPSRG